MDYAAILKFEAAIAIVLVEEGILSNNPADPGGLTMYGLSKAAHPDMPWPPTLDQAKAEYKSCYWDPHHCDEMPWQFALSVFDAAINQTNIAVVLLQAALHVTKDGIIGPATISAMTDEYADDAFRCYLAFRADAYFHNPDYETFGNGWLQRLMRIAQASKSPPV